MNFKISTLKGIYTKGEPVTLLLTGEGFITKETDVHLKIYYLDNLIYNVRIDKAPKEISIKLEQYAIPEQADGFGCICDFYHNSELLGSDSTAFDFTYPEKSTIRYGFLSDFGSNVTNSEEALDFLAEFHMSHVQFYDWTYRHHEYKGPSQIFRDTMGKEIDSGLVKHKIEGCQSRGMKAIGYGAVYAAGEEYQSKHPELSLYDSDGNPYNLIDKFFIMDISKDSQWRKCLMEQYKHAYYDVGFDGIHMDTYGFPKRAFNGTKDSRHLIYLEDEFPGLIEETRKNLEVEAVLIFNNVGNWPVEVTGPTSQDGVYIEVWEPYDSYSHIRQIILNAAVHSKPVILAAYLAPFRLEENHGVNRALNSALILHSAITSLGASHLLLGETGTALTQGYYNDYTILRDDEKIRLKRYYDFQVRYQDIFYDQNLSEISETHTAGENREYFFSGAPVSADGRAGTVWSIVRESKQYKVVSLINLTSQDEQFWNKGKKETELVKQFSIQLPVDGTVEKIFTASPDRNGGSAISLSGKSITNERGPSLQLILENLPLWTLIVIDYGIA